MSQMQKLQQSKIPEVTLGFWIIKIIATTLGETGGDAGFFVVMVAAQVLAKRFHPALYWAVIVATTTVGTTMADFADRSLGTGYTGGSLLLFALLMAVLAAWQWSVGSVSVDRIDTRKAEVFYWVTILFSNTLGTALGDFLANSGPGYEGGALIFSAALALVAVAYFRTAISRTALFWTAFILTRPLGATLGDFITKPHANGGLELGRVTSSAVIVALMVVCVVLLPQRAGGHPGAASTES